MALTVKEIDAFQFRNHCKDCQEFGGYGTHIDFNEIPEGEVWMDQNASGIDKEYWLIAAEAEIRAIEAGLSEDDAYDYALAVERSNRERETRGGHGSATPQDEIGKEIYDSQIGEVEHDGDVLQVWLVDGELVRDLYKSDFIEGGNAYVYPWIEEDEIWVEKITNLAEIPLIVLHESTERGLLKLEKLGYEKAHDAASKVEFEARQSLSSGEKSGPLINTGWIRPKPTDTTTGRPKELSSKTSEKLDKLLTDLKQKDTNISYKTPAERARAVDLVRTKVKVKNCANCQWILDGYCYNKEVDQPIEDPEEECCGEWDIPGLQRVADELSGQKALSSLDVDSSLRHAIDAAASKTDTDPSEAQKKSGRYTKGSFQLHGLTISIENPRGSVRSGVGKDGEPWSIVMKHHYGYIQRTESEADGDHVDVFIGPEPERSTVYVIDQVHENGEFDEHKCMLGFASAREAKAGYLANYEPGWKGFGGIKEMTIDEFKQWVKSSATGNPAAKALSAMNESTGGALVPPAGFGTGKLPLIPMEEERGQRSLLMAPETGEKDLRKKYRKKLKNGWVTIRGCPCFVEDGVIVKGPKGLVGTKDITPQWVENEDNYRGVRSLKELRAHYKRAHMLIKEGEFDVEVQEVESGKGWRSIIKRAGVVVHSTPVKGDRRDAMSDARQWIRTGVAAIGG